MQALAEPTNLHVMPRDTAGKGPRTTQKAFTFGAAREPFEKWCEINGYDQNAVVLAGWLALQSMDHEQRATWFAAVKKATERGFESLEDLKAATAAGGSTRPAVTTNLTASRPASSRAG